MLAMSPGNYYTLARIKRARLVVDPDNHENQGAGTGSIVSGGDGDFEKHDDAPGRQCDNPL